MKRCSGWIVVFASFIVAMLVGTPPSPTSGQNLMKLKYTGFRVLYLAPMFIGIEKGFFRDEGIDLQYVEIESGALGQASLIGGQAHFSETDPLEVGLAKDAGLSLMMVYNLVNRVTLDFVLRTDVAERLRVTRQTPIIERFRALRGLRIGITRPGAPTDNFPRYFLKRAGLDADRDAQMVQVGGVSALAAAFRAGRIDGFMLSPPLPQALEKEGVGRIIIKNTAGDVPELSNITFVAHTVTEAFSRHNPNLVLAYVRVAKKSNAWMRANPDETLKILNSKYFTDTPVETLRLSWEAILPAISTDGRFTEAGIRGYVEVFDVIGRSVKIDSTEGVFWTNRFLR